MLRNTRAIIFDLDDTLYPLERFVWSGFDAVASRLETVFGIERTAVQQVLRRAFEEVRGRELQACLRYFDLPETIVPSLVDVIREHHPSIDLPAPSAQTIAALEPTWRIAIVTNGVPEIQTRKVNALGLADRVDAIVFADGHRAKPAPEPFLEASERLGVPLCRSVVVGDDPVRDIYGGWRLGMKTIHVAGGSALVSPALMADASVRSLVEVPDIAERLVA